MIAFLSAIFSFFGKMAEYIRQRDLIQAGEDKIHAQELKSDLEAIKAAEDARSALDPNVLHDSRNRDNP